MGYTNYAYTIFKKDGFDDAFLKDVKTIVDYVTKTLNIKLEDEDFEEEIIHAPTITKECISFNGDLHDETLNHEDFVLRLNGRFSFCKTAQKPYDCAVKAVCLLAEGYNYLTKPFSWDGDMTEKEYSEAIDILTNTNLLSKIKENRKEF